MKLLKFKEKEAYTLLELLVILMLIGIIVGTVATKHTNFQSDYELITDAHELMSNLRLQQANSMRYYEQKQYENSEMRDDNLWGIIFISKNKYNIIQKKYKKNDRVISDANIPIFHNSDIYPSKYHDDKPANEQKVLYSLDNKCTQTNEIFFNALGKTVNIEGEQCRQDIVINITEVGTDMTANIVINITGHISINLSRQMK